MPINDKVLVLVPLWAPKIWSSGHGIGFIRPPFRLQSAYSPDQQKHRGGRCLSIFHPYFILAKSNRLLTLHLSECLAI